MKKTLFSAFLCILCLLGRGFTADPTTPRTGLVLQPYGEQNWDVGIRNNFSIIDSSMCIQAGNNAFTGTNSFSTVSGSTDSFLSGSSLFFNSANNTQWGTINNPTTGLSCLEFNANRGVSINGATPLDAGSGNPGLQIFKASNQNYGSFAVMGSSADASTAYSGFIATSPIASSTLWALPTKDGTSGQALVTDGLAHLSFSSIAGGGGLTGLPLPAGATNYVQVSTGTLQTGATFYVSSGTVSGNLYANTLSVTGIGNGQCLQTGPNGLITGTGAACLLAGGSFINNQNTLQSGATFYVSSASIAGTLSINQAGTGLLGEVISYGYLGTNGGLSIANQDDSHVSVVFFSSGPQNQNALAEPYVQFNDSIVLRGVTPTFLMKQRNGIPGNVYEGFTTPGTITTPNGGTTLIWTLPPSDALGLWQSDGSQNLSISTNVTASSGLGVTYGLAMGSGTVNGPGNGQITLTISGSTYTVVATSTPVTVGHSLTWSTTNFTVADSGLVAGGGSPGAPVNSVQYNAGAGSFGGSSGFQYNGTSVTVVSSMTITAAIGQSNNISGPGFLDIYHNNANVNQILFDVGSQSQKDQFYIPNAGEVYMGVYGAQLGNMDIGNATNQNRITDRSRANYIDVQTASTMTFHTDSDIGGGDIIFQPQGVETFRTSNINASNASNRFLGSTSSNYSVSIGTSTNSFHVAISTNGHVLSYGQTPSVSSCGSTPNGSVVGNDHRGVITVGGGSVTACTLTFAKTYGSGCTVSCIISDSLTTTTPDVSTSPTALTMGFSATIGGGNIFYDCEGVGTSCQ